ncbi:MAG: hypothetical protein WCP20_10075 [Desulfuromonadales bacterium]
MKDNRKTPAQLLALDRLNDIIINDMVIMRLAAYGLEYEASRSIVKESDVAALHCYIEDTIGKMLSVEDRVISAIGYEEPADLKLAA